MTFIKIVYVVTSLVLASFSQNQTQVLVPQTDTITSIVPAQHFKLANYDYPEIEILSIDTLKTK